ncbi:MAG: hypothetical protein IJA23_04845, partial [Clostridia bacterium]|nr:hypothetical protein [Clostridia bacterium]
GEEIEDGQNQDFVSDLKDGMTVNCGGVVSLVKKIMTKQTNKPMAIITVEDIYGEFDCMVFNKIYEKKWMNWCKTELFILRAGFQFVLVKNQLCLLKKLNI